MKIEDQVPFPVSQIKLNDIFTRTMTRVYLWMALGLFLTAGTAVLTISSPFLLSLIFSSSLTFYGLMFAELILVIAISGAVYKLSPGVGLALFFLYSALNGATLSVIFLVYQLGTISLAFSVTAVTFGVLSIVGFTTKQDLSKWGGVLFMALIGLIIASVVNIFLANSTLDWIISYAGVLIFMGLTVYDTKRIKGMALTAAMQGDDQVVSRIGVLGALRLYLDFINLFLFLLRIFGRRRR